MDVVVAELRRVAVESPEVVRIVVGLLGAIVLFAGARLYRKALPPLLRPLDRIRSLSERSLGRVIGWLQAIERAIPVSDRLTRFLEGNRPDVVIVSPLVDVASDQVDMVRAARALGIPTVAAISSWDNLTSKGLLRVEPDLVTVWNDVQKDEAITLHGVPENRVIATGAQCFDHWFGWPPRPRAEFCARVGLDPERPYIFYAGGSLNTRSAMANSNSSRPSPVTAEILKNGILRRATARFNFCTRVGS